MVTGGIKTPFFNNNSDYSFPEDSPYKAAKGILEPILAGRTTAMFRSESSTTIVTPGLLSTILILSRLLATPEQLASEVVRNSRSWWPSVRLWAGSDTTIGWFVSTFLWHTFPVSLPTLLHALLILFLLSNARLKRGANRALGLHTFSEHGPHPSDSAAGRAEEVRDWAF